MNNQLLSLSCQECAQSLRLLNESLEDLSQQMHGSRAYYSYLDTCAKRFEWIDDLEFWSDVLEARNISVHAYETALQDKQLPMIKEFARKTAGLIKKIQP